MFFKKSSDESNGNQDEAVVENNAPKEKTSAEIAQKKKLAKTAAISIIAVLAIAIASVFYVDGLGKKSKVTKVKKISELKPIGSAGLAPTGAFGKMSSAKNPVVQAQTSSSRMLGQPSVVAQVTPVNLAPNAPALAPVASVAATPGVKSLSQISGVTSTAPKGQSTPAAGAQTLTMATPEQQKIVTKNEKDKVIANVLGESAKNSSAASKLASVTDLETKCKEQVKKVVKKKKKPVVKKLGEVKITKEAIVAEQVALPKATKSTSIDPDCKIIGIIENETGSKKLLNCSGRLRKMD